MALIARNAWKINMVGTIQANCTGIPMAASVKGPQAIKKKTYEQKMWQHNTQSLVTAVWPDNNLVKTLSNYHQQQLLAASMMRRRKIGEDGTTPGFRISQYSLQARTFASFLRTL